MPWLPLQNHTHYSLQDAINRPEKFMRRAADFGYGAVAMTDHANIGCAVDFVKAAERAKIKPILGCEFSMCREDASIKDASNGRPYKHLVVLARSHAGRKQLVRAVSASNSKEFKYYSPRINLDRFADYTQGGNLIAMSGHPWSELADCLFSDPRAAYCCDNYDYIKDNYVKPWVDAKKELVALAEKYISIFGKENFFLEVMQLHPESMPAQAILAGAMRWLSKRIGVPTVAVCDTHYTNHEDQEEHHVLLSSMLHTTKRGLERKIIQDQRGDLIGFMRSKSYCLPSPDDMAKHHSQEELDQAGRIAEMCDSYDILHSPMLPIFDCPNGMHVDTYLEELCVSGWRGKIEPVICESSIQEYRDRLNMELSVIKGAGLSSYFLIVQDYMNFARNQGWLLGPGRGSGAGCLVSYLTGITGIDPIPYGLIFERFYNAGRNKPGHISLPDIDSDFPIAKRELVFHYLQKKYGYDKVAKIATFTTMKGKMAVKEVLRAFEISPSVADRITKALPDPARIQEELEEMRQRGEEPSIINFALDVYRDELSEWVVEREDGTLEGEYAKEFDFARKLEGVKKGISTHAAGVVIAPEPLANLCPLDYDEANDQYRAAVEYTKLEQMGICKFDILGVAALDKGEAVRDLVAYGEIYEEAA